MRRVSDPSGRRWRVDVAWTDIRFGEQIRSRLTARGRRRAERKTSRSDSSAGDLVGSALDAGAGFDLDTIVVGVLVTLAIAVLVIVFPWLLVGLLDLALVLVFPFAAIVVIIWRVARHRPFTITAGHDDASVMTWRVVGIKEARRIERLVADAIVVGGDPAGLFPEYASRR